MIKRNPFINRVRKPLIFFFVFWFHWRKMNWESNLGTRFWMHQVKVGRVLLRRNGKEKQVREKLKLFLFLFWLNSPHVYRFSSYVGFQTRLVLYRIPKKFIIDFTSNTRVELNVKMVWIGTEFENWKVMHLHDCCG